MKIAGVQMDIQLGQPQKNVERMSLQLRRAAVLGAKLVIFPECALTGYCFDARSAALAVAEPVGGRYQQQLIEVCRELDLYCVTGLLEKADDKLFNCAALLGPTGIVGSYRKVHLPYLGIDRYTDYGDRPFEVHALPGLNIGLNICYDAAFPEAARALALLGADLIALPTNWPPGAECMTPAVICTRALENKVYYAAINRIGNEQGTNFIGRSCICGPDGLIIDSAQPDEEKILIADLDISRTREKLVIRQKDIHEIDRFADRRPDFYTPLTTPHQLVTPRKRLSEN